ncbi:MAG: acyl-CoA thioesterase [Planctomycetota bacterium]|jgi:YbgC/YbaW family acyl-CoA thioester hydrolase
MAAKEPKHQWHHRVRIFELDAYGHTNHTVFLQWLEEGREGFLQDRGFSFLRFLQEGHPLVMVHLEAHYTGQVAKGESVRVETRVGRLGKTSVQFVHEVLRGEDGKVLHVEATMVFVNPEGAPVPIPAAFRDAVESGGESPGAPGLR